METAGSRDLTRRDALKKLGAATAIAGLGPFLGPRACGSDRENVPSPGSKTAILQNAGIGLSLSISGGTLDARSFLNRISGEEIALPPDEALLEFSDGSIVSSRADGTAEIVSQAEDRLELLLRSKEVEIRVIYELPPGRSYVRKSLSLRCLGRPRRLVRADLENWMGVGRDWRSTTSDSLRFGSHPIHCETVFAGVEFVAAFNEFCREGFILRSRPGGVWVAADWVALNSTVVGVTEAGRARDAFLSYLEDVRLKPARFVACYNSWWTLPAIVTHGDNLSLIRTLAERLHGRQGAFFDIVTTDMGWSDPRSIWEIDRQQLPNGFKDVRGLVEAAGGRLGLWMSPGESYSQVCDYDWMERNGYFVIRGRAEGREQDAVSLADPKYRGAAKGQLERLIRENHLGHIKYDGFSAEEPKGHHDLLPDEDSVEPIARYSLELLEVTRRANPDLVTEETFFNRVRNYVSPWILKYSDTVYGNAGDDCPRGMNPAPDYRESHTNAREFYIQESLDDLWLPQNAVQYFDIVHCDAAAGFPNHAAMAVGRGRFFLSTYVNPRFMSDEDWRIYAGLLRWARANQEILRNTSVIRGRVERGECYGYSHWAGTRGIVVVRNPSNASCTFEMDLRAAGAPAQLSGAVCHTQFPYRKGLARGVGAASVIPVHMAPWELLFIEIVPERDLAEPVVIGARWYCDPAGTRIIADPGNAQVALLEPGESPRTVNVERRAAVRPDARITQASSRRMPREDELKGERGAVPTTAFELDCVATIPGGPTAGRLLLLVEFPGRAQLPSRCTATLNGMPAALGVYSSDIGLGNYMDLDHEQFRKARPFESEWCWYECAIPAGESSVHFSGLAGSVNPHIGLWVWSEERLDPAAQPLSISCPEPAMPEYRPNIERDGRCIRPSQAMS